VTDPAGRITYCNRGAVDLWGEKPKLGVDKWSDLSRFYYDDGTPMPVEECPTQIALKQGRMVRNLEAILERSDGTRIPIMPYPTPLYDGAGAIAGVVNMTVDISEHKKAELELAERTIQLSLAAKAALVGSFSYDIESDQIQASPGYVALHGFPDETTEITRSRWLLGVHPEDRARLEDLRSHVFSKRSNEYRADYRIVRPDGEVRWIEARCFVTYRSDGRPQRVLGVNIDTTERKRSEEHQLALNAELDHRVKNVLATVSAIITQTLKADSSLADFVTGLGHRIKSLAATHELLSHNRWHGVSLEEIVRCELAPYATGNAVIGGPRVTLRAEAAQAVAMVLHELATNAGKYGAFSNQGGRLSLRWRRLGNGKQGRLAIEWQELDGPTVLVPDQAGYGTSVIRELIPFELGGTADLEFAPDGLRCRLEIPPDWIRRAGTATHASCRLDAARPDARA
jgi:PAS domain S-box-containing protein